MVEIRLGGENGQTIALDSSESMVAVRTHTRKSISPRNLTKNARSMVQELDLQIAFEGDDITLWRSENIPASEVKKVLKSQDQIEFAGTGMMIRDSNTPIVYTEKIFLALHKDAQPGAIRDIINSLGEKWRVARRLRYGQSCFLIEPKEPVGREIFDCALSLVERSEVDRCHPEFLRKRDFKSIFPSQWHLGKRMIDDQLVDQSASVDGAWTVSSGKGISIAVIDDGVDTRHPEFSQAGKVIAEYDFTQRVADASPKSSSDNHGTACAGVACASGAVGAAGVAPDANLMPIRLTSGLGSMDESDAIFWAAKNGADVISCSWGPEDGNWWDPNDPRHNVNSPIPDNTALALEDARDNGRQGQGCVICWAAGNGNESVDLDGYASFEGVTAVAACSDRGDRSVYSDFGNAVDVAFPSNNFEIPGGEIPLTPGIWTTDRRGSDGYNVKSGAVGDFANDFGGTSSACPGVAGTAALIMSIDPSITARQVEQVIKDTADPIDQTNGDYDVNGHSPYYGRGKVNAERAVYSVL